MMMTVKFETVEFQHEVQGANDAFDLAAAIHEVFGEPCGVCGSTEVKPVSWQKDGKRNRKLVCKCGAEVFVNAPRDGGRIFIGRKDRDGNKMPNNGWAKYDATRTQGASTTTTPSETKGDAYEEQSVPF